MSQDENVEEDGIQTYLQEAAPKRSGRLQEIEIELAMVDCMYEKSGGSFKGPVARAVERLLRDGIVVFADPRGHWIDLYETRPYPLLTMEFRSDDGYYKADEPKRITLKVPQAYVKKAQR